MAGGRGGPSEEDPVGVGERFGGVGVVEDAQELGGDEGGVHPPVGRRARLLAGGPQPPDEGGGPEAVGGVDDHGAGTGQDGADEDLEPGDMVRGQGEDPGPRPPEARVGGAGRGR